MSRDAKEKLAEAGVKVGASLFGRLMDHFAQKRPHGIVARFRKRFGRITPEQLEKLVDDVQDTVRRKK